MTRQFVSMVEAGRTLPSEKTLRIIADRLGKPVEFFAAAPTGDREADDLPAALLALAQMRMSNGDYDSPQRLLRQLLNRNQDKSVNGRAYTLLGECLRQTERHEKAVEAYRSAILCLQGPQDRNELVGAYLKMGASAFAAGDFLTARGAYEEVLVRTSGMKLLQPQRLQAHTYLGTTLLRLGELDEAIQAYHHALQESASEDNPELRGRVALGLGRALYEGGRLREATMYAERSLDLLQKAGSPDWILALHNVAVLNRVEGKLDEAYRQYQTCLSHYRRQKRWDKLASVYEELTWYWLEVGNTAVAFDCGMQAMRSLEQVEDGELLGRVYRALGAVAERREAFHEAYLLYRASYEGLERLMVKREAQESHRAFERMRSVLDRDKRGLIPHRS